MLLFSREIEDGGERGVQYMYKRGFVQHKIQLFQGTTVFTITVCVWLWWIWFKHVEFLMIVKPWQILEVKVPSTAHAHLVTCVEEGWGGKGTYGRLQG